MAVEPDRFLEHALVRAAHYIANASELQTALEHPSPECNGPWFCSSSRATNYALTHEVYEGVTAPTPGCAKLRWASAETSGMGRANPVPGRRLAEAISLADEQELGLHGFDSRFADETGVQN